MSEFVALEEEAAQAPLKPAPLGPALLGPALLGPAPLGPAVRVKTYTRDYRSQMVYDHYDEKYAASVKRAYAFITDANLKRQFDAFSDGLLQESFINRHVLLDAIRDFALKVPKTDGVWGYFTDAAFNCRPWQGW